MNFLSLVEFIEVCPWATIKILLTNFRSESQTFRHFWMQNDLPRYLTKRTSTICEWKQSWHYFQVSLFNGCILLAPFLSVRSFSNSNQYTCNWIERDIAYATVLLETHINFYATYIRRGINKAIKSSAFLCALWKHLAIV